MPWLRSHFYSGVSGASGRNALFGGDRASWHPDNIRIGNDVVIADGDGFHVRGTRNDVLLRGGVLSIFGLALLPMTASRAVSVVGELTPRSSAPM